MEPRVGLPNFWCTHIAKALAGEQPCLLQPWMNARFKFDDRGDPGSLAKWRADHSMLLQNIVDERRKQGWYCDVERFFRVAGTNGIVSGKADLVLHERDKSPLAQNIRRPRIVDVKSGKPKDSDVTQVLIEMVLLPLSWKSPGMQFEGEVVYANGNTIVLEPREAEAFKPRLFAMIRELATMERPTPAPSRDDCQYCNVPDSECSVRWKDENETVATTSEF